MMVRNMWIFSGMDGTKKFGDLWFWNEDEGWNEVNFKTRGPEVYYLFSYLSLVLGIFHLMMAVIFSFFRDLQMHFARKMIFGHST